MNEIKFKSGDGLYLSGVFDLPTNYDAFALMAHGITMDKNEWNNLHFRISSDLNEQNIGTFRFDYRGHGNSEGTMREMTVCGELLDVEASVKKISEKWDNKIAIVASSFGAGSSILYTALNPEKVSSLVLLNPVLDYEATFLRPQCDWAKETFNEAGYDFLSKNGFILLDGEHELGAKLIAEFSIIKPYEYLQKIKCPVLTIHGNKDSMVPHKVSKKYGEPNRKSRFVSVKNAEHGFLDWNDEEGNGKLSMENQQEVTKLIINWINKWSRK